MHGKQGFPGIGAIVAGAVACGVLATPGAAFATPDPTPSSAQVPALMPPSAQTPTPPSAQALAPMPPSAQAPSPPSAQVSAPMPPSTQAPAPMPPSVRTPVAGGSGQPVAGGSSSLSAHPFLGHFGVAVDRPLSGRITLANPTGETLAFKVTDPALLPAGITLDADGLLGGTSRVSGTWTVPVEACVASGGCATGAVTITVTCECGGSSPSSLPPAGAPCSDSGASDVLTS